jgi:hypothetical protein
MAHKRRAVFAWTIHVRGRPSTGRIKVRTYHASLHKRDRERERERERAFFPRSCHVFVRACSHTRSVLGLTAGKFLYRDPAFGQQAFDNRTNEKIYHVFTQIFGEARTGPPLLHSSCTHCLVV